MIPLDPSLMLFSPAFRQYLARAAPLLLRVLVARSPIYYRHNVMALHLLAIESYWRMIAPITIVLPSTAKAQQPTT